LLLNAEIPNEIHVMRKTVTDGSNTSGFQRTAIVGLNGVLKTSKGDVSIPVICLEEEASQIVYEFHKGKELSPSQMIATTDAAMGFATKLKDQEVLQGLDVRTQAEWEKGHIPGAKQIYVSDLVERVDELDPAVPVVTYCGTGYRASIASSILEKEGFVVHNIPGSMSAWRNAGFQEEIVQHG